MPSRPPHPCSKPGCGALTTERFCADHAKAEQQRIDQARGSAASRGYDHRWQKARKLFLNAHPLCAEHGRKGELKSASVVDHIRPHKGDQRLFWDRSNWQSLCKDCHDLKTARHDGAFGRPVAPHKP
jgi:5-methylcytosine-specific restriction protein A